MAEVRGGDPAQVAAYLPDNYRVLSSSEDDVGVVVLIEGEDKAGWTLDDYVIPRLASGLYWAAEVTCLDANRGECAGPVEFRSVRPMESRAFPRCERHFEHALDRDQETRERYPSSAPSDFSPLDAGESWGEDDY